MNNIVQVRNALCEEIDNLRCKKTTPAHVNAIVNASGEILSTIKVQMEYSKITGKKPVLDFMEMD